MLITLFYDLRSWFLLCILLAPGSFLPAQQFYSAAFPDEEGMVELWVPELCGATIEWQEALQGTEAWQSIPGATGNSYRIDASFNTVGEKKFRASAVLPPATTPEYSFSFGIWVLDSLEEIREGQLYDGVFIYEKGPDVILGSIFTELTSAYGCSGVAIPGANDESIGGGIENTTALISACAIPNTLGTIFDTLALLGYDDWFLPSIGGLAEILQGYRTSNITELVWPETQQILLSSTQWDGNSEDRILVQRAGGSSSFNFRKDQAANIIAARQIRLADGRSHRVGSFWSKYLFPELLQVANTPTGSAAVAITYLGENSVENEYNWQFPSQMELQSGEGPGPYQLLNNFGGYQRLALRVNKPSCEALSMRSPFFKIDQSVDIAAPFPETHRGDMVWGDFNNDGLKDLLITGTDTTALYRNLGNDAFSWEPVPFPALSFSAADWGDMDNDGDLDLALIGLGADDTPFAGIYLNGAGGFEVTSHTLPALSNGFVKWIDYNRDGRIELLISGATETGDPLTKLFQLGAGGAVVEVATPLPALKNSGVGVADYNRDNYPDLILLGNDGDERRTQVFRNELGIFTPLSDSIIGLEHGGAIWTDYNGDGELDFAVAGNKDTIIYQISPGSISASAGRAGWLTLYENDGAGEFREVGNTSNSGNDFFKAELSPIFSFAGIDAADYDNDGDDDLILSGIPAIGWVSSGSGEGVERLIYRSIAQIMRNDNEAGYVGIEPDIPSAWSQPFFQHHPLLNFECSTIGFVDTDSDDQLDIYRGGRSYGPAAVYKWQVGSFNEQPGQPEQLTAAVGCDSVLLEWDTPLDDWTLGTALTYELYLQHVDSSSFVFSPVNPEGLRSQQLLVRGLPPGTYRWGLQAMDGAKAKSGYREGVDFTITAPGQPMITQVGDTLFSDQPLGNQWYNDQGPISGATASWLVVQTSGSYYTIATIEGCASPPSEAIDLTPTSSNNLSGSRILKIWPSPAEDYLYLAMDAISLRGAKYHIYSTTGQLTASGQLGADEGISVRQLLPGSYLLRVRAVDRVFYQWFVRG